MICWIATVDFEDSLRRVMNSFSCVKETFDFPLSQNLDFGVASSIKLKISNPPSHAILCHLGWSLAGEDHSLVETLIFAFQSLTSPQISLSYKNSLWPGALETISGSELGLLSRIRALLRVRNPSTRPLPLNRNGGVVARLQGLIRRWWTGGIPVVREAHEAGAQSGSWNARARAICTQAGCIRDPIMVHFKGGDTVHQVKLVKICPPS